MKTLVLSPRMTPDSTRLMKAAEKADQPVIRLTSYRPADILQNEAIAIYGEPLFAISMAIRLDHVLIEPPYDWLASLPEKYTHREIKPMMIGEARTLTTPHFIKNVDGIKGFHARVYPDGAALPSARLYPDDYRVLAVTPVSWEVEYRCFVLDRVVLTLSIYSRKGTVARLENGQWDNRLDEIAAAREFCQAMLDDPAVDLPSACVVDVGFIEGHGWAVVEANPAYGAGIYGCDPQEVLHVVNQGCMPMTDLSWANTHWVMSYEVGG